MPLTADTNAPHAAEYNRTAVLAASQTVFVGALLMRNTSTGHVRRGAVATGCIGVGRAEARAVSVGAGSTAVEYRVGTFRYRNATGGDAVGIADTGKVCFILDDDQVARTDGTGTRSPAGVVDRVDASGVRVRFDEALTAAALS